jgi:hypothetical protein
MGKFYIYAYYKIEGFNTMCAREFQRSLTAGSKNKKDRQVILPVPCFVLFIISCIK